MAGFHSADGIAGLAPPSLPPSLPYPRLVDLLAQQLGFKVCPPCEPRHNIAPSQMVMCIRTNPETLDREFAELKWGLVPSWAKDPSIGNKLINARGETVFEKPAFRKAFHHQRCLVLADGFYE